MNFQQLRIIRETVRRNFNLTEVAGALFTSQSGVSKHIKDLEDELGVELYVRKGKRLLGLTDPGKELAVIVDRMLLDASNIKNLAAQYSNHESGELIVATTHTQARYALPPIVSAFKKDFPKVHLRLLQDTPDAIAQLLLRGEADIGIATESIVNIPDLETYPYYRWRHAVVVQKSHPLAKKKKLSLADLAEYPIITYHEGFTGRSKLDEAFAQAGLEPDIVMSALDADVIKSYVELDLGIGIIASVAFNKERDHDLKLIGQELFDENTTYIAVRNGHYLRKFGHDFIQRCLDNNKLDS